MDKQEKIVCAAVKEVVGIERVVATYITLYVDYPCWVKDGSHGGSIFTKGFMTNKNRFVDAKNAFVIAVNAQQVMPSGGNNIPDLKPSDLY